MLATQPEAAQGFRCTFCGSTKPPRVEKHITFAGGAVALGLPFVVLSALGSAGHLLDSASRLVLYALPVFGLAFAVLGRKPRHFCQDCTIRLG